MLERDELDTDRPQEKQGEKRAGREKRDPGDRAEPQGPGERRAELLERLERLKSRLPLPQEAGVEGPLRESLKARLEHQRGESTPLEALLRARGLEEVPLARITCEGRLTREDFGKVSEAEMRRGLTRWRDAIRPALTRGEALERSDWAESDRARGLGVAEGDARVYAALLERLGDPIRLEADMEGNFSILNGRHRVQVGRDLGLETLPASVARSKQRPG